MLIVFISIWEEQEKITNINCAPNTCGAMVNAARRIKKKHHTTGKWLFFFLGYSEYLQ